MVFHFLLWLLLNLDLSSFRPELHILLHAVWPSALWTNATSCCLVFVRVHYIDYSSFRMQLPGSWLTQRLIITPGLASLLWLPITSCRDYKMLLLTYKAYSSIHLPPRHAHIYAVFFFFLVLSGHWKLLAFPISFDFRN